MIYDLAHTFRPEADLWRAPFLERFTCIDDVLLRIFECAIESMWFRGNEIVKKLMLEVIVSPSECFTNSTSHSQCVELRKKIQQIAASFTDDPRDESASQRSRWLITWLWVWRWRAWQNASSLRDGVEISDGCECRFFWFRSFSGKYIYCSMSGAWRRTHRWFMAFIFRRNFGRSKSIFFWHRCMAVIE